MKSIYLFIALWAMPAFVLFAQNSQNVEFIILEKETEEPLIGATVFFKEISRGAVSNINGKASVANVPSGTYKIRISSVGFRTIDSVITISPVNVSFTFALNEVSENLEEVVVQATRSTRTVRDVPTRIEFIGAEELEEKTIMNAANISLVLRESTGIQIQQTSLSSGNSSIRIQGLDGRYTQLLKDGFPLFGGFSGGLSTV